MERFAICLASSRWSKGRWQVRCGDRMYGGYLSRHDALLDAIDAAEDAASRGLDAEVWIEENGHEPHLEWSSVLQK